MVNENDIYFVLNKTKLEIKSLILLIEEERDFNLLIYSIASSLSEYDLLDLDDISMGLKLKLVFYHFSNMYKMNLDDCIYLNNILIYNYSFFFKQCREIGKEQPQSVILLCKTLNDYDFNFNPEKDVDKYILNIINRIDSWREIIKKTKLLISGVNITDTKDLINI